MSDILDKLKRYEEEIKEDLKINEMNLSDKSFNIPQKKHYWASRLITETSTLNKLIRDKKKAEREAISAVKNNTELSPVKLSDTSVKRMVNTTNVIQQYDEMIEDQKLLVDYLGKVEKIFSFITNDIKNIIEVKQLELM